MTRIFVSSLFSNHWILYIYHLQSKIYNPHFVGISVVHIPLTFYYIHINQSNIKYPQYNKIIYPFQITLISSKHPRLITINVICTFKHLFYNLLQARMSNIKLYIYFSFKTIYCFDTKCFIKRRL